MISLKVLCWLSGDLLIWDSKKCFETNPPVMEKKKLPYLCELDRKIFLGFLTYFLDKSFHFCPLCAKHHSLCHVFGIISVGNYVFLVNLIVTQLCAMILHPHPISRNDEKSENLGGGVVICVGIIYPPFLDEIGLTYLKRSMPCLPGSAISAMHAIAIDTAQCNVSLFQEFSTWVWKINWYLAFLDWK